MRHGSRWGVQLLGQGPDDDEPHVVTGARMGWDGPQTCIIGSVVREHKRQRRSRLDHKGGGQAPVCRPYRSPMASPRRRDEPFPARGHRGHVVSPEGSQTGKRAARQAHGAAGQRGWRKRRLLGHEAERDVRVLRASGRTSLRCLVTRASAEPTKEAKQMTAVAPHAGAASRGQRVGRRDVSCRSSTSVTGCG